jgi:hypothetical protein
VYPLTGIIGRVDVFTLLLAPVVAIISLLLGAYMHSRRDDKQWDRDRVREDARWQLESRTRWLSEQYRLYSELMKAMSEAVSATRFAYELHPSYASRRRDPEEPKSWTPRLGRRSPRLSTPSTPRHS